MVAVMITWVKPLAAHARQLFNVNLKTLAVLSSGQNNIDHRVATGIYAPATDGEEPEQPLMQVISDLRNSGERVVCGFPGQKPNFDELFCDRELTLVNGAYQVVAVSS